MKSKLLTTLFAALLITKSFAQVDSLPVRNNIKLRLPVNYYGFLWFTAGLQYERLLSARNSLSLGATYHNVINDRISSLENARRYQGITIHPQWRHYFREDEHNYFNGFYAGASALYMRDNFYRLYTTEKRHILGIGGLGGYQHVIKKRFSISITSSLHVGLNNANRPGYKTDRQTSTIFNSTLDFHVGYIF